MVLDPILDGSGLLIMRPAKTTPMIQQYLSIKEAYPDALLFFRMGDFYEMFFEDAEVASRVLEITLTSRNKKDEQPIPMCGVPAKAVHAYIGRLIDNSFKVAICDQVENPDEAKGLVKREVVRVITPGMIVENEYLDAKTNNYLSAWAPAKDRHGLAYIDISTGEFKVTETDHLETLMEEVSRISPREMLMPASVKDDSEPARARWIRLLESRCSVTYLSERAFEPARGRERLLEQFQTVSLEGFGCERLNAAVGAAGALMKYVQETQKQRVDHITRLATYTFGDFLTLDDLSCRNLEILKNIQSGSRDNTLLSVMDKTVTAMGGRLFRQWMRNPLYDVEAIEARFDAVEEAGTNITETRRIRDILKTVHDLERLGSKVVMGHANARDLVALKRTLFCLPDIYQALGGFVGSLFQPPGDLQPLDELARRLEAALKDDPPPTVHEGQMIKIGHDARLDELIQMTRDGKTWLLQLEAKERAATGISTLKIRYNKVFGYYIEVSKAQSVSVPPHYVRRQTLVNAERYITPELKDFELKVFSAQEQRVTLEYALFARIKDDVVDHHKAIQNTAEFIANLDYLLNLGEIAAQNRYVRPEINTGGIIDIKDGRHPVVEKMITGERFVPNSVYMDNQSHQMLIITGPNMAGKSTLLRQVALHVIMAQVGSFVPAASASISLTDRIFTRVGALDNLSQGQSTFMVEMEETANILNHATQNSLIIMDEIGRGTSTFDGLSIAWAVAEFLHDLRETGVKTLFATHYHELTDLARAKHRVKNYNIAVKEWNDDIIFLRKMVEGGTGRSYGIQVARLAGIPDTVIQRAKTILLKIENSQLSQTAMSLTEGGRSKQGPTQLELFHPSGNALAERLKRLDISTMTPLEALNSLNELQASARQLDD